MNSNFAEFQRLISHPLKFRLFLLTNLPSAYFSGVRVKSLTETNGIVTVPYKWFSRNPFRSTYFACLSMAAEMSTGVLVMAMTYKRRPSVSLLVTKTEASYFKKASGITSFTCEDGNVIKEAIERTIQTGEPQEVRAFSKGVNAQGESIADFYITWSLKARIAKN